MSPPHGRIAEYPVDPMFLERWSPRTFTGEPIDDAALFTMFEAARWAPSSSNQQPWRFLYAKRDAPDWPVFYDPLFDGNKRWVGQASVLVAVLSKRMLAPKDGAPPKENYSHSFDAGAAWGYLALQASLMNWSAHAMGGFLVQKVIDDLNIPDDYRIECMVAIGRYSEPAVDAARPNSRSPQSSFVRAGRFTSESR